MARPRYERDEQTARQRIIEAFWRMVEDGPYDKVYVRELVRESGVNKNTFYYHFEGVDDLARQATRELLDPVFLTEMLSQMQGAAVQARLKDAGFQMRLSRVRTVARAKGTPELQDVLKSALAETWSSVVGFDLEALDVPQRVALEFLLGGIMSVLAYANEDGSSPAPDQVVSAGIPQTASFVLARLADV